MGSIRHLTSRVGQRNSSIQSGVKRLLSLQFSSAGNISVRGRASSVLNNMSAVTEDKMDKVITLDTLNPCIKKMEYAVRGPLLTRATEIENELKEGVKKPFDNVIKANIGDCHAMGQHPITFIRQVLALVAYQPLMDDPTFPDDAKKRAKEILGCCRGASVGSYSDSAGLEVIRKQVAKYIEERDGHPCNYLNVTLCAGASDGIKSVLKLLIVDVNGKPPGVMIPIPQYPLYSATLSEFNMAQIGYYLDEDHNWGLNIPELERAITEAKKTCTPRAIVVINPGNPTGQVLTRENIENVIKFAYKEKLFILADEVYQHNIYAKGSAFHSFKKVLMDLGEPYSKMELASFMSASKGYMGECGIRGGYSEVINLDPEVKAMFNKSISVMLCPTVFGQATMSCIVSPPKPGDPSHDLYVKEKNEVLASLKERAELVFETFNKMKGITSNPVQGAMYAFPKIELPPKAIAAAEAKGMCPSTFYAFEVLEKSGLCVVPGSGFGQRPGTYHFRTTILPQTPALKVMLERFSDFHTKFMTEYSE